MDWARDYLEKSCELDARKKLHEETADMAENVEMLDNGDESPEYKYSYLKHLLARYLLVVNYLVERL